MKLEKVIPVIQGRGDFDVKATMDFAEKVLTDGESNNLELTLAYNLRRSLRHMELWLKKYLELHKSVKWIPVADKLPEEPPEGLTDLDDLPEYIVTIAGAKESTTLQYMGNGQWCDDYGNFYSVVAWMHMPDVYKEEQ